MADSKAPITSVVLVQSPGLSGARLREALSARPGLAVVGEVATSMDAVATAGRLKPDALVLDVGLVDLAGHEVLRAVRAVSPETRIFLHTHAEEVEVDDVAGSARWIARLIEAMVEPVRAAVLEARLVLPNAATSVPVARNFVTGLLVERELDQLVDACALVVSELVANAVRHVPGPCALEVTHRSGVLRVGVADSGPGMPDLRVLGPTHENGRGLHIVSAFSDAWGIDQLEDGGKLVWAELAPTEVGAR